MPIFTTSPEHQARQSVRIQSDLRHLRGFTLVELLVVLAIGAMLIGLVPVAFNKLQEGSQYRDTLRSLVTDLRQAHQSAVAHGQPIVFQLDLAARQYGIRGQTPKSFPPALEVKTTTGSLDEAPQAMQSEIVFLPEGGSTGGTVELVRSSGGGVRIRVDWLFGQITQEPRTP